MSRITLKNVDKSYGAVDVLTDINLDIGESELVVFVGPSGCGKSTLLRLIAGLDQPTAGDIAIGGKTVNKVPAADRGLAMVFQSYALYPHMSVRQNLAFGLENSRAPKAEIAERIAATAKMLDIEPYLDRRPGQLSGGQRQRVAIGRAIVRRPVAFLLDEPLSNLDAELRVSTRAEISALHARLKATMIYVTHDQTEAMTLANRIVVLRAGRVEQVGTPLELYNAPANQFVAGFIGSPSMSFLDGRITSVEQTRAVATLDGGEPISFETVNAGLSPGEPIKVGVRPQQLTLATGSSGIAAEVMLVEQLGAETVVHAKSNNQPLLAVLAGQQALHPGDTVHFSIEKTPLHIFDAKGHRLNPPAAG